MEQMIAISLLFITPKKIILKIKVLVRVHIIKIRVQLMLKMKTFNQSLLILFKSLPKQFLSNHLLLNSLVTL